jgi:hypothetical protein
VSQKPFIPRDKPKSWVVGIIAGLSGLGVGLIGFVAAGAEIRWLYQIAAALFLVCWAIAAVSIVTFLIGCLQGRYSRLEARPWREQVW